MPLDPQWIPKVWRGTYTLMLFVVAVLLAASTALAVTRAEAARVVDEKWNEKLRKEVTEIATSAAVEASRNAVSQVAREQIAPIALEQARFTGMFSGVDGRVRSLEEWRNARAGRVEVR